MERKKIFTCKIHGTALSMFQLTPKMVKSSIVKRVLVKKSLLKLVKKCLLNIFSSFLEFCYEESVALMQLRVQTSALSQSTQSRHAKFRRNLDKMEVGMFF